MGRLIANFRGSAVEIPISYAAAIALFLLAAVASLLPYWTGLRFAPFQPLYFFIVASLSIDLISRVSGSELIARVAPTMMYGVMFLAMVSLFGVMATYATQRLNFPLQDKLYSHIDSALGFNWMEYVHYIDRHPFLAALTRWCYRTMSAQMALPVIVFAWMANYRELRVYLAAIAISLVTLIVIAMFLPALTPVAWLDKSVFHNIEFSACSPIDVLRKLRESAPMRVGGNFGGLLSFPSFHAVVGIMIPLVLRRTKLFPVLVLVNLALLSGAITEGGHYFCDLIAGGALAVLSYIVADRLQVLEDTRRASWAGPIPATACDRAQVSAAE